MTLVIKNNDAMMIIRLVKNKIQNGQRPYSSQ
jgi:hypothetical protein